MGDATDWEMKRMEERAWAYTDDIRLALSEEYADYVGTSLIPNHPIRSCPPTDTGFITTRKDTDMAHTPAHLARELRRIERDEELLAARKAELQAQMDFRKSLPDEPDVDTVIRFTVQHDNPGIVYTYVAFRSRRQGASWHTTSKSRPGPYTWDDMLTLMMLDVSVKAGARTLEFFEFDGKGKWVR